ncbi:hypothetical protein ACLB2K_013593 [Fragaria x ananassa]
MKRLTLRSPYAAVCCSASLPARLLLQSSYSAAPWPPPAALQPLLLGCCEPASWPPALRPTVQVFYLGVSRLLGFGELTLWILYSGASSSEEFLEVESSETIGNVKAKIQAPGLHVEIHNRGFGYQMSGFGCKEQEQ